MGTIWTEEQKKVISLKNRNLLVSAAAGSGKTSTLVERIIQKVLDPMHPIDIDRMLIVTFTKAAASDMRDKISRAIEHKMDEEPEHMFLHRQYTLIHHAQITTIDSFCLYVVRNYFHMIGLEPSFRIADPGELQLLRADVQKEVMEEQYAQQEEGFLQLADRYAAAKSDAVLTDFVQKLYDFSQSYPWPEEWLASLADAYQLQDAQKMDVQKWMQGFLQHLASVITDLQKHMEYAKTLCMDPDGPNMYLQAVTDDLEQLELLTQCHSFQAYETQLSGIRYTKLGVNRKYEGSKEKQEQVKALRKQMKDTLTKLRDTYFYQTQEAMLEDIQKILPDVQALCKLTLAFTEAYQAKKAEKNVLDFSDVEHYALNILVDAETKKPTDAAKELREMYEEVMIDEYQDSNYVQETILRAVSREEDGHNNLFMVGDVKQSIYRFRLARPELFIEKYKTYTSTESKEQKIDLHENFRSRKEVLASINYIFEKIMHEDLGKVEYDSQAELKYGNKEYDAVSQAGIDSHKMAQTELLLIQAGEEDLAEAGFGSLQEAEAHMVASRIKELLASQRVLGKQGENQILRQVHYRDIVILLRSISGWADTFAKILTAEGIPVHTTSQTGYFGTIEIRTILSMLSILDNPLQDIPFAAVLSSPIGGFDGADLANIRTESEEHFFYDALQDYAFQGTNKQLREKSDAFLQLYGRLRRRTSYTPIHELIQIVLRETGYASYIQAMPAGEQRRANVDMLLEKAIAYEKTSYKGLFHFVQYIEKLKKYEVDFGEADITGENEDVVRIMSIHKSKGLEFPVVFVCGMHKQFNRQDSRSRMVLHPEYGIGLDYIDAKRRIRKPGLIKKVLENEIQMENQGEELRILYVALTRAKEKLIMTGAVKEDLSKTIQLTAHADETALETKEKTCMQQTPPVQIDFMTRAYADSYLDWVYPIVVTASFYELRLYQCKDLQIQKAAEAAIDRLDHRQVQQLYLEADPKLYERIDKELSWQYAYERDTDLKTKLSVSELKRQYSALEEDALTTVELYQDLYQEEQKTQVPAFMQDTQEPENRGALRGSALHKMMEEVDFVRSCNSRDQLADIRLQIEEMLAKSRITPDMKTLVSPRMLAGFLKSPLAERMAHAQQMGNLYKEQPFVMGIPASQIYEGASDELVLIQGIVDVYWKEPGGIVILDYKTDAVQQADELIKRYRIQLDLYAQALEKATGEPVKEKLMYSFRLQKIVEV